MNTTRSSTVADVRAGKVTKNSGLGHLGADVIQMVPDELLAKIGAAAAAGDRQQLLTLARELVAASHAQDGDDEDLFSLSVVASKLDCCTRTVWRLVASKELPEPVHVRGKAKWFSKDLRDYLDRIRAERDKR